MVRSRWVKAVMASVVSTSLVWGQSAAAPPPKAPDDATGRIITVHEAGKPAQKCRVVKVWVDEKGNKVWQVEALDTGEVMTIVAQGAPVMGEPTAERPKSLRTQIFHWNRDHTPPPGAPLPPTTIVCDSCTTPSQHVVSTGPCPPVITNCPTCPPSPGTSVTSTGSSWGKPTCTTCDTCTPSTGKTTVI